MDFRVPHFKTAAGIALAVSVLLAPASHGGLFDKKRDTPRPSPPPANRFPVPTLATPVAIPVANPYAEPEATGLAAEPSLFPEPAPVHAQHPLAPPRPQPASFRLPFFSKPDYTLPYSDYKFRRSSSKSRGFFDSGKPTEAELELVSIIRRRAEHLSRFGLTYKFGGDHPSEGGMDCSGTMKYLLSEIGFSDMPRTSYQQYDWLRKSRTLQHSKSIPERMGGRKGIRPGDLIFWGGTYNSGHKVSHVMVYLGQGGDGQHWMFGARGKKKKGLNGAGVDIFRLESGYQKSLVGYGSLPGVS